MKKLLNTTILAASFTGVLFAVATPNAMAEDDYKTMRAKFQHNADMCDLINIQQVVQVQTLPVKELKKQQSTIKKLLAETKEQRQACYEQVKEVLADVMAVGFAESEKNTNDTALIMQLELDEQLPAVLDMRQKISGELLDAMIDDVSYTIKNESKLRRQKKGKDLYLHESDRTMKLIRQDMSLVLNVEGRQLQLDEIQTPPTDANRDDFVKLKLRKAMHYLARTLLIYEDVQSDSRNVPVSLAKLRSEYLYAAGQLNELLAMDPELKSFSEQTRPSMQQLLNRAQLLELDIEGALRDYRNKAMEENLNNWLSELYQDLSQLSLALKTQLQWFGVEQVVSADEKLPDLPADLEAFIEKAEEKKEEKKAAPKESQKDSKKAVEKPAATPQKEGEQKSDDKKSDAKK